jgi:hypothetical protein
MATLTRILDQERLLDFLPRYGESAKVRVPVWNESQKMFICDEYWSRGGYLYYKGVRFCDQVVVVERVGLYHSMTYIDGIELYAFRGTNMELVQKRDYEKQFRSDEFVRNESESMTCDYIVGAHKMCGLSLSMSQARVQAKCLIERCYKSYLDSDFNTRLIQILPAIEQR